VLAEGKSYGFHRNLETDEILITSDTLVLCEDKVMGKPESREDAYNMLRLLSGREHKVITAVTIRDNEKKVTFSDTAVVSFKELTDNEIYFYIDTFKPFDKAGAYAIQENTVVDRWIGSYTNIVGLPMERLCNLLRRIGVTNNGQHSTVR
jgi:septum formation protein